MRIFNLMIASLVSLIFVGVSPRMIPVTVDTIEELRSVRLGFPIPFVEQDLTRYSPPLPHQMVAGSPLENPTEILWGNFFISVALCATAIYLALDVARLAATSQRASR